ncbi:MAG: peptidoglycan-binding protein [Devosia sp.]
MARAFPQTLPRDGDRVQSGADWQSLRGELVALLDQVETQVARTRHDDAYDQSGRPGVPMAEPAPEPGNIRHREALRSVQRAVDRFNYRDEPLTSPGRESLQSAIDQIRGRQSVPVPAMPPPPPQPRAAEAPRLDQYATALGGMTARLERIESELKSNLRSGGDVKMIADQVSQLAGVVELLAGAVGETGQVKRLEGQIASLGKLIAQSREADSSGTTRRLDDMSSAMGRLADLQVQFANKIENPVQTAAFRDGMQAIEASVRNVYDRIDTLERSGGASPAAIEHLTAEMARFTEALRSTASPQNLIELVDALNSRISDLESGDRLLHSLRKDLSTLREAVTASLDPRFQSLERRIDALNPSAGDFSRITQSLEALNARIGERPIDPGVGQIEAQVRQLVARMDQTSEQLSGLAKLYANSEPQQMPDFEALADMVAARTSAVVKGVEGTRPDMVALADMVAERTSAAVRAIERSPGIEQTSLDGLEQRITAMLRTMKPEIGSDQFGGMRRGIEEVNERLQRLEESMRTRQEAGSEPDPSVGTPAAPALEADIASLIHAEVTERRSPPQPEGQEPAPPRVAPRQPDIMPAPPAAEAPLTAPAFPEPSAEPRTGARRLHPGLEDEYSLAARYEHIPDQLIFDPSRVTPPPAPTPSLGLFEPQPMEGDAAAEPAPVAMSSRNTFIEAARRAAQRKAPAKPAAAASNSLIGRALARFNKPDGEGETPHKPLAGDKPARTEWKAEPVVAPPVPVTEVPFANEPHHDDLVEDSEAHEVAPKESFLLRNRKAILLGAAVVALGFLTYNLMQQRAASQRTAQQVDAGVTTGSIDEQLPIGTSPATDGAVDLTAPRMIPMADSLQTGAIDPAAARGFAALPQGMPAAFDAASDMGAADTVPVTPLSGDLTSPVKVELPPEGIGPIDLRQAAASGDARAQFEVAAIYTEGRAVPQDFKAAAIWYERAAAQGFAPAQYRLGSLYENGDGVDKDLGSAKLWYERAAEAGNRMSMHNLAALYAGGQLGKQQFDSAAKWFEEAASRGMTDSQFNLGMLYARGLGVPQSLENSFKWFGIAALSGDKDAAKARDDMARSLDAEVVGRLSAEIATFKPLSIDLPANFAPIGTWSKTFDPGETIGARDIVASVQVALSKLGYDIGTPDGVSGPKTMDAIKAFERATGMTESGQINPRLLAVLGSQPV